MLGGISGHAGLFGNALDLLRFSSALLQSLSPTNDARATLFQHATVKLFSTRLNEPAGSSRALGWDTPSPSSAGPSSSGTFFSAESVGHLGYAGTSLWIDLSTQTAIVLLSNRTWPLRQNQAIRSLRPRFHDAVRKALAVTTG